MFWKKQKEKEIEKVIKRFGEEKGTAILTYYYTFTKGLQKRDLFARSITDIAQLLFFAIEKERGESFLAEFKRFNSENTSNKALVDELDQTGDQFFNPKLLRGPNPISESASSKKEPAHIQINDLNDINNLIGFLDFKAKETLQKHGLLKQDGTLPILSAIYCPEAFANNVMHFCRDEYKEDGELRIRSEYLVTSFYSSICATILYKKNAPFIAKDSRGDYPLFTLNHYINLEYVDWAAEELLGTKNGQPLAESIWKLIAPFIASCLNIFDDVSQLDDRIVLAAIKNSYTIGMLVGDKYSCGQNKTALDIITEKDFFEINSPYEICEETTGKAVRIEGTLSIDGNNLSLLLSDYRSGDATIRVFPIDSQEQQGLTRIAAADSSDFRQISVYGKLVDKGRWDSELHHAFIKFTPQHAKLLKTKL